MSLISDPIIASRLSEPESKREWYRTEGDAWATRPWTLVGVQSAKQGGGWFRQGGYHDFDSATTAAIASTDGVVAQRKVAVVKPSSPFSAADFFAELEGMQS